LENQLESGQKCPKSAQKTTKMTAKTRPTPSLPFFLLSATACHTTATATTATGCAYAQAYINPLKNSKDQKIKKS
jgi:hypothetical protein